MSRKTSSLRSFCITTTVFVVSWLLTLIVSDQLARHQATQSYLRNPLHSLDLRYPHWLNAEAHRVQPDQLRILFFGDSTLHGINSTSDQTTIQASFARNLNLNPQIISFALNGLTPPQQLPIMQEAIHDGDYVVFNFLSNPELLSLGKESKYFDRTTSTLDWVQEPFVKLRSQTWTWLGDIPSAKLSHAYNRLKADIRQKTPNPTNWDPRFMPVAPDHKLNDLSFLSKPITPDELVTVKEIAQLLRKRHAKALVYSVPFHVPHLKEQKWLDNPVYRNNRAQIKAIFEAEQVPFIEYNERDLPLEAKHFYDACHLLDDGCDIFGKILADDWKKAYRP